MLMEELVLQKESFSLQDGGCVFTIPQKDGSERFVMLRITGEDEVQVGLVEDVTATTLERRRIEHERDYDALTGLYSRQAFFRVCGELFEKPNTLRHAALMMTDLDNLKTINDTYGHDWGDVYLRQTAHSLQQGSPSGTVVARLSGDEFLLLFYGYETREALRADIKKLEENFAQSSAALPDGKRLCIRMSGGVAWYPEDAVDLDTLKSMRTLQCMKSSTRTKGEWGVRHGALPRRCLCDGAAQRL